MACPTCGETMQNLGGSPPAQRYFWCPRCGTLKRDDPLSGDIFNEAPKLVHLSRNVARNCLEAWYAMNREGVLDCLETPAERAK
jgi:transposase